MATSATPETAGHSTVTALPMFEQHRAALIQVVCDDYARNDPHADPDGVPDCVQLVDGDLVWHIGGGLDLRFSTVRTLGGDYVRVVTRTQTEWMPEIEQRVDDLDTKSIARTIWQLINAVVDA